MSMLTVRKRPVEVEAVQWTGDNAAELLAFTRFQFEALSFADRKSSADPEATAAVFDTLHSTWVLVHTDDYIIRGVKGEFYPCRPDVFAETYEVVS